MLYLWIKAFHIISVISWMLVLLYLPRLMVYHCDVEAESGQSEIFKTMERRLLRLIGIPAFLLSWVFGLSLVFLTDLLAGGLIWLHIKLTLVVIMSGFHMRLAWHVKQFSHDRNGYSARYFRLLNEVPTVLMIGIVILVVVKPF